MVLRHAIPRLEPDVTRWRNTQEALRLEQSGEYDRAAKVWAVANRESRNELNQDWSVLRSDFCLMQNMREKRKPWTMPHERESLIEKRLVAEVNKAGGVAFKFVSPGRRSVPDRIALLPGGRLVFVECKASGKPPRADQLREHERLRTLGFTVVVLGSKNLKGVI